MDRVIYLSIVAKRAQGRACQADELTNQIGPEAAESVGAGLAGQPVGPPENLTKMNDDSSGRRLNELGA